ncbi:ABC transporter permease [Acidobacteria bacterium ACD]|nr:MAG: ABC transporter permease [Acidobacteriota bacterium]MCE7956962.1 ABC transporter permease [Acidobacteria bacterium ACB2]MDL1948397.1 ABC transporter permease [Acidobacteria bacterium ACD]
MKRLPFLLTELVRRDLTARYAGSAGGLLWGLLNPLILCALYGFVFAVILRIQPPEGFPGGYVDFLLGGLLPWIGFNDAVVRGASAVTDQSHLVRKLPFPPEILVASSVVAALVLQAVSIAVLGSYLLLFRGHVPHLGLLSAAFLLEVLLLAGPVLALAALNVLFRDLAQILGPILMIAFYVTPILYPASLVPASMAPVFAANPLADLVALFRAALFGLPPPPFAKLLAWMAGALVLACAGLAFFRRCRKTFADVL